MTREPSPATPRRSMTPARRKRVLEKYAGHCAYPCCTVSEGLEIDHTIALEIGGKDEDENLQPLCRAHHVQKTRLDARIIAKVRRLHKKNGFEPHIRKHVRQIKSRGFQTGHRPIPSRPFSKRPEAR